MSPERQLDANAVLIGKGAAVPAKTIPRGAANTVLTQTVVNEEPAFTKVNLGTMVTGALDLATMVTGDLPVGHGGVPTDGAANTVLTQTVAGTDPAFTKLNLASMVTGLLAAANGGTGLNTAASTGVAQISAGTWSVSPIDLATADVTGVLPIANGGTGATLGAFAVMQFTGVAVPLGSTRYLGLTTSATELEVAFICPVTGTITLLYTIASLSPTAGQTFTYTLRVNLADSALTHVVSHGAGPFFVGTSTGAVAVTAGQGISMKLVTSSSAATTNHNCTIAIRMA